MAEISRSSRNILFPGNADQFPGDSLFDRIGRAVCEADCLPRKELYEAWETARRIRRRFRNRFRGELRGGPVVELAAGHGLLAAILLLLDDSIGSATCIDVRQPPSHRALLAVLEDRWPRLAGRITYLEQRIDQATIPDGALVASVHACGELTDQVLDLAIAGGHRVAVLPCCHDLRRCDSGGLAGWMDGPLAIDATRVARLRAAGYEVHTATIPADITPKNRLLLGWKPAKT